MSSMSEMLDICLGFLLVKQCPRSWAEGKKRDAAFCEVENTRPGKLTFCYGKSPCYQWVNPLFLWSCSIAMLVITRGVVCPINPMVDHHLLEMMWKFGTQEIAFQTSRSNSRHTPNVTQCHRQRSMIFKWDHPDLWSKTSQWVQNPRLYHPERFVLRK